MATVGDSHGDSYNSKGDSSASPFLLLPKIRRTQETEERMNTHI